MPKTDIRKRPKKPSELEKFLGAFQTVGALGGDLKSGLNKNLAMKKPPATVASRLKAQRRV
jgi:hypothetical protein